MVLEAFVAFLQHLTRRSLFNGSGNITSARTHYGMPANIWKGAKIKPGRRANTVEISDPKHVGLFEKAFRDEVNWDKPENLESEQPERPAAWDDRERQRQMRLRAYYAEMEFPREPNLLTWSAKEQIRHLHRLEPAFYDTDRLCDSFPITPADLKRLLRRKDPIRNVAAESIQKHDADVEMRWRALKTGHSWRQVVSEKQMSAFLEGRLVEAHFSGNAALPSPPPVLPADPPRLPAATAGPFTALIKSYLDMKKEEEEKKKHKRDATFEVGKSVMASIQEKSVAVRTAPNRDLSTSTKYRLDRAPKIEPIEYHGTTIVGANADPEGPLIPEESSVRFRRSRREYPLPSKMQHEVQERIISRHSGDKEEVREAYEKWFDERKPLSSDEESKVQQQMVETARAAKAAEGAMTRKVPKYKEAYKKMKMGDVGEDRIEVPEDKRQTGKVYKTGDSFYDANGQFMYRIPGI